MVFSSNVRQVPGILSFPVPLLLWQRNITRTTANQLQAYGFVEHFHHSLKCICKMLDILDMFGWTSSIESCLLSWTTPKEDLSPSLAYLFFLSCCMVSFLFPLLSKFPFLLLHLIIVHLHLHFLISVDVLMRYCMSMLVVDYWSAWREDPALLYVQPRRLLPFWRHMSSSLLLFLLKMFHGHSLVIWLFLRGKWM